MSDDARFDALFPDHPLSRVRSCLARIERTLTFDAAAPITFATPLRIDDNAESAAAPSPISAEAVGSLYLRAGKYADVEKVITDAMGQAERTSAADPMSVCRQNLLLGFAYEGQRKLVDAEAAFRKASDNFRAALGQNHPDTPKQSTILRAS